MSNILKKLALTSAVSIATIASGFSQNKADLSICAGLKPNSDFSTKVSQSPIDNEIMATYRKEVNGTCTTLDLAGPDLNNNKMLDENEINYFRYEKQSPDWAFRFSAHNAHNRTYESTFLTTEKRTNHKQDIKDYDGILTIPYVRDILPNLKQGPK